MSADPEIQNSVIKLIELHPVIFGGGFTLLGALISGIFGSNVKSFYLKFIKKDNSKQVITSDNRSSTVQQNTGRDAVINHFYSPVSVGIIKEGLPVIKEVSTIDIPDMMSIGFLRIALPEKGVKFDKPSIDFIGEFFNKVFVTVKSSRNGLTMLNGAIFSLGSEKFENKEWREHCAASLRELFHHWKGNPGLISEAFNKMDPNIPTINSDRGIHEIEYKRMKLYYDYFSEICHHQSAFIILKLRNLYGEEIKTGEDNEKMFLKVVRDFLVEMEIFIKIYAKKK
ncbi:MAG: hypothetical protein WC726_01250 [Parcubacteria group bacterium]|jgi:hypothetical protein